MTQPALARRLGTPDAVLLGVGSMVGAGVFAAFAPAARAAGTGLLLGLLVAAVVACCNATATAQLAAAHPSSGGAYLYGRERLGPWWGFLAGWGFVVGKTASCAAMALTAAAHLAPPAWQRPVAVVLVVLLAAVNHHGITRTAALTRLVVAVVLVALAVALAAALTAPPAAQGPVAGLLAGGWYGTLQAAGLLFFAFAGYARIATMGEEVRDPARTIPRAVLLALGAVVLLYAAVGLVLLRALGPQGVAEATAPLTVAVRGGEWAWAAPLVRVAGAAASLGALLALLAGVGRTALAMARHGDLPGWLAGVHPRHRVPHHAGVALAVVVCALVLLTDLRGAIGASSAGVLLYYLVANVAAWTQPAGQRRFPRGMQVLGALGCAALVVALPAGSVLVAAGVLAVGVGHRAWRLRSARPR